MHMFIPASYHLYSSRLPRTYLVKNPPNEHINLITSHINKRLKEKYYLPYIQPKMHCRVAGKLFAAVIDLQKTEDINFALKARLPGVTLLSREICWAPAVPANRQAASLGGLIKKDGNIIIDWMLASKIMVNRVATAHGFKDSTIWSQQWK